jgi:hypothetical protein
MNREAIIKEIERGHVDGVTAGNLWKVGDPDAVPDSSESPGYKDGFNKGFDERKNNKAPLVDLPAGNLGPVDGEDVNFEEMKEDFDGDNGLDKTPLDLSIYDNESKEPEQKKQRKWEGGKSKKRKPSKKSKKRKQSKKAKRSRKQKK